MTVARSSDHRLLSRRGRLWLLTAIVTLGAIAARIWVMRYGSNFDFDSYLIVAEIQSTGGNVYASTARYNYGPPWFLTLGALWNVASLTRDPIGAFRLEIVSLLTAADLVLAWLLYKKFGVLAGMVMLFAPIGVIISGYHNQFDNVAIAIGAIAVLIMGDRRSGPIVAREWFGLVILALSLSFKHVLLVFPLWLAIRQEGWTRRIVYLVVPGMVFAATFAPWTSAGGMVGIRDNVVGYRSFANAPLLKSISPIAIPDQTLFIIAAILFAAALLLGAWFSRHRSAFESLLIYLLVTAIFTPAVANQYLAIPLPAVAAFVTPLSVVWLVVASLFLIGDGAGLHNERVLDFLPDALRIDRVGSDAYQIPTMLLAATGIVSWWRYRRSPLGPLDSDEESPHSALRPPIEVRESSATDSSESLQEPG